jgi:2-oxoglutarate dehydrogenase E1 component
VLGFEYGYSLFYKDALVIWEAQYGDFSNEAQVIIDEYIMAGRDRWEKLSRLTLFLPHGFEGQGPEHSSAKIERFLQLGNKNNVNIVIPTTPAQLFHLLRRQVLKSQVVPLIVFTPKGLLRDPKCLSSGRIYFDLISERVKRDKSESIAIIRVEQLYPLNLEILKDLIVSYKEVDNICWIQEEPKNMGAWNYIKGFLQEIVKDEKKLHLIARKAKATPAVGSYRVHQFEYEILMKQAFEE